MRDVEVRTTTVDGLWLEKIPDDVARYRRIIEDTKPEVIVETGTRAGGSAAWFASFGCDVVTVDTSRQRPKFEAAGVTYIHGYSTTPAIVDTVAGVVAGRRCMVSLDSDHHAPHVAAEIDMYGPLVAAGCYLVVEDGIADLLPPHEARRYGLKIPGVGGPLAAVARRLVGGELFDRAHDVEHLTALSTNPAGWWVRRG